MSSAAASTNNTETAIERALAVAAFPVVMTSAILAAHYLYAAGYILSAAVGTIVAAGFIVGTLERFFPHHESWLHSNGDLRIDIVYAPLVTSVTFLVGPAVNALGFLLAAAATTSFGAELWPTHWHLFFQVALALVIAELPKYWHHRLQHETDFLWRFHATHHSVPRLYFLNASRFHPIDIYIDGVIGLMPLVVLGAPVEVLLMFSVFGAVHGLFQHANIPTRIGPLNYIFSMAELHRWHHSRDMNEANHNYGQNVIFWDLVFGTFYLPSDREPPENIGLADLSAFPTGLFGQLASPFTWSRIRRKSAVQTMQSAGEV
jgi:sterol desaturase/sphingolipid hydroxylase (fatty acid hydroxylase superfamily)